MYRRSSRGKDHMIDLMSSLVSKRTQHSSDDSNSERFKTPLDSQTFSSIFKNAPTVVKQIILFDTLGSTFILRIFAEKDWVNLFRNFEDPIDELVKEFYSNARFTEVEFQCWVRGKDFIITLDYLAKILCINRPTNVDISSYGDRLPLVTDILQILGVDHEVSTKGTSIGTAKFEPELKTLTLTMFSNLYPLTNTGFINLGRAQFLCDLIIGVSIDIYAHIFQTMGKTAGRVAARMCLPFYNIIMKIMVLKGVCLPKDGTILVRLCPISMESLQMSKSHSSAEWEKQNPSKTPKSESLPHATLFGHGSIAHTTPGHTETASLHTPKLQSTSTQPRQSSSHTDSLTILVEGLHKHISGLANVIYSTNNQVQMRLTTIETQLDEIQRKLEESFQLFVQKRGEQLIVQFG